MNINIEAVNFMVVRNATTKDNNYTILVWKETIY